MQQPQLLHSLLCIPVDTRIYGLQSDPSVLLCTRPYETHGSLATDFFFLHDSVYCPETFVVPFLCYLDEEEIGTQDEEQTI